MLNIPQVIADELSLKLQNVHSALELLTEGATIPFIARYRKEKTGSLNEIELRDINDRFIYLQELETRKQVILDSIASQNLLSDSLKAQITACLQKNDLEDLYLPYKPKRRTRATMAKEKGLTPLAEFIKSLNHPQQKSLSVEKEAEKYLCEAVNSIEEALNGAKDILAEEIAEKAQLRAYLREFISENGAFISHIKNDYPEGSTKFEMYRNFQGKLTKIAPHNILALFRGEAEKILTVDIDFDEVMVMNYLESKVINTKINEIREFYREMLKDSFNRLLKPALIRDVRSDIKAWADIESIKTFEANLRELLLSPPAGMKPTLAIDPGFRTGCKVAVLSETGQFLEYQAIFPHTGQEKRAIAKDTIKKLINKYNIELIAIGNGTASRETDEFITEVLANIEKKPIKVMVNESGASIYSASDVAISEFPDLDITVRGAISIGRRLQDPLAELVKIDPKSIGVGQYQHDVDQKLLKKNLEETVESCVNYVGVDLNTASKELLMFVSGINQTIANNIVIYRNEKGKFKNRKELLKVKKLGAKTFELAAGFLRIRDSENPLDNTAVHPESYSIVKNISADLKIPLSNITNITENIKNIDLKQYITENIGLPTLQDITKELEKPGRDPRAKFQYATFKEDIKEIRDLKEGMELEGIVTNVVNFGAFIDIGVHQDGLVHISQLADKFVSDTNEIVKVGQVVKVRVLEVNEKLKRISLSMKS
ncbi:MAG: RNA-binding transcriptional accessory protein [Cyanobacteria bacterium]|nr:RNA-binding transcriptional accessory protein [Cyanobacteria bacterium CG_2015-16_32_12]NCO79439.1 RNA-binding transcriptional accessory protein [Cyanobacteria bacterium CG_2015-22_32_23]NCQ41452.1 RNA-binding transcriptional accessory protein [Cyanobacteria bacterium CG_2015-04_32_10]NCS85831.1 RNA-binding transcriptional accessory protein [Cyanobacteria bacterium CG_2015-02_32_10]